MPSPVCLVLRIRTHASCPTSCEYDVWFGDLAWPLAVDLRLHLPALTASFWCALLARTMPFCVLDLQIRAHGTLHPPAPVSDPIRAVRTCALPLRTCLILPVCALFTVLLVCGCCDHNIYHSTRCMHLHLPGSRSRLAQSGRGLQSYSWHAI